MRHRTNRRSAPVRRVPAPYSRPGLPSCAGACARGCRVPRSTPRAKSSQTRSVHQPLKSGIAPKRRESGVDPEPAGREVVRDPNQWLDLVERLLRLTHEHGDTGKLVLEVPRIEGVAAQTTIGPRWLPRRRQPSTSHQPVHPGDKANSSGMYPFSTSRSQRSSCGRRCRVRDHPLCPGGA